MRITVNHNKPRDEVRRSIDAALADAMKALPVTGVRVNNFQQTWNGPVMAFSLDAKMGLLRKSITGTVEVTDKNIIIDADLGFLEKLLPVEKARTAIQHNMDRLLA